MVYYGFIDLVRFYLKFGELYGILVDFFNEKKDMVLFWVIKCGYVDIVKCLLFLGVDLNKENDKGLIVFYWVIWYEYMDIVCLFLKNI